MNDRNLALTAGIGLYLLLGALLYLQSQPTPLATDAMKSMLQQELSPLDTDIKKLDAAVAAMKKDAVTRGVGDGQIDDLIKQVKTTNESVKTLADSLKTVTDSTIASSKSLGDLARQPANSGNRLSQFLGNLDSDPQLKQEFQKVVQDSVPQKQFGKLVVTNHTIPTVLTIDSPGRQALLQTIPAGAIAFPFPAGTKVENPRGGHWAIEAPEFELHLEIFPSNAGPRVLRSMK